MVKKAITKAVGESWKVIAHLVPNLQQVMDNNSTEGNPSFFQEVNDNSDSYTSDAENVSHAEVVRDFQEVP